MSRGSDVRNVKALIKLTKVSLRRQELEGIAKRDLAALAALGFALNQTNVFARAFLATEYDTATIEPVTGEAAHIQRMVFLRSFSSSLIEIRELFEPNHFAKKKADGRLRGVVRSFGPLLDELDDMRGYRIAKFVRNKCTFHFDFQGASGLSSASLREDLSMYLHRSQGNTFFPLGEWMVFTAHLAEYCDKKYPSVSYDQLFDEWRQWTDRFYDFANRAVAKLAEEIVLAAVPGRTFHERVYWPSEDLVFKQPANLIPVFFSEGFSRP